MSIERIDVLVVQHTETLVVITKTDDEETARQRHNDWLEGYRFALRNLGDEAVLADAARYASAANDAGDHYRAHG